ncbi:hypothetical protein BJ322DRAFT_1109850 [Thelephora terrestris]|uniref:Uncharacterized protein n=1 Tax=Thelephora terrestris TaxID=56493 RepID=A0A9P6L5C4_9AGAM|nr:hypothetical protein BJ322DRAFT_1109850 [Thelephora terrestris]
MESLPLMLQAALLLLGYALSNYLFTINNVVAGGVVGVTAFGVLFYLLICSAVTLSYNRPSQFPVSFAIRSMVRSDDEHRKYPRRKKQGLRQKCAGPNAFGSLDTSDANAIGGPIELIMVGVDHQAPLFNEESDWRGYVLDANCRVRSN